jgi:hypothetical protein
VLQVTIQCLFVYPSKACASHQLSQYRQAHTITLEEDVGLNLEVALAVVRSEKLELGLLQGVQMAAQL